MKKKYINTDNVSAKTEYIHDKYLNDLLMDICNEIYNLTPFETYENPLLKTYDENFLHKCYLELFKLDRENRWIMESENSDIVWNKAHNEHYIILKVAGKLLAYINEPFDFIDSLYEDWTDEEIKTFKIYPEGGNKNVYNFN